MADTRLLTLVQEDKPTEFNQAIAAAGGKVDLSGGHFRGYDLRKFNLAHANLSDAYLRSADVRGLDLSQANLVGASMRDAKVSGVLFPSDIDSSEIRLSLEFGTRLRMAAPKS